MTPLFNAQNYFSLMQAALEREAWEEAEGWRSELFSALCGIKEEIMIHRAKEKQREIALQNAELDE